MLTVLLTVWAVSLVVLSVLLAAVIAGQTLLAWTRRLRAVWTGRTVRRSEPVWISRA